MMPRSGGTQPEGYGFTMFSVGRVRNYRLNHCVATPQSGRFCSIRNYRQTRGEQKKEGRRQRAVTQRCQRRRHLSFLRCARHQWWEGRRGKKSPGTRSTNRRRTSAAAHARLLRSNREEAACCHQDVLRSSKPSAGCCGLESPLWVGRTRL